MPRSRRLQLGIGVQDADLHNQYFLAAQKPRHETITSAALLAQGSIGNKISRTILYVLQLLRRRVPDAESQTNVERAEVGQPFYRGDFNRCGTTP